MDGHCAAAHAGGVSHIMENLATDLVSLLRYLLPGFLTAWIFYGFTSYPKPSQFERIVQALIFTLIIQVLVLGVKAVCFYIGEFLLIGNWTSNSELITSVLTASLIGFIIASFANNDLFHRLVRKLKISKETSYASEWYAVLSTNVTYIILHLNDERRIYGWPIEWPSEPNKGHFAIQQASWLSKKGKDTPMTGVETMLVKAEDVKWVEFMNKTWEN